MVELLLSKDRVNQDSKDKYCRTPLLLVAGNGHGAIVNLLLAKSRGDPNSEDNDATTQLLLVATNVHEAVVLLLLERGVSVITDDNEYRNTFLTAAYNGRNVLMQSIKRGILKLIFSRNHRNLDASKDIWTSCNSFYTWVLSQAKQTSMENAVIVHFMVWTRPDSGLSISKWGDRNLLANVDTMPNS